MQEQIKEIVDQYSISHKGDAQCKCIEGARGHLIAKLEQLLSQQRQQDIEKIEKMFEENYPNEEEDDTLDMANIFIDFKNKVLKDVIKKLNDKKNI